MTADVTDLGALARRWERWARTSAALADLDDEQGDVFAAALKRARARVRRQAADLLRAVGEPGEAARIMRTEAVARWQPTPPLIGYDRAAVDYTRARTWQACYLELDPVLAEVQSHWA